MRLPCSLGRGETRDLPRSTQLRENSPKTVEFTLRLGAGTLPLRGSAKQTPGSIAHFVGKSPISIVHAKQVIDTLVSSACLNAFFPSSAIMVLDDARNRILQAAGPVFADKGFQGATVREICQAARVNAAGINYYFGDKERLYIETVKCAQRLQIERVPMPSLAAEASAEERLTAFVTTMLTRMLEHETPWQSRLMMREILAPSAACQELVEEYFRPQFEFLCDILRELAAKWIGRQVQEHELQQFAFSVVGQCVHYRVGNAIVTRLIPAEERAAHYRTAQLANHVTRFTLAALRGWQTLPPSGDSRLDGVGLDEDALSSNIVAPAEHPAPDTTSVVR